MEPVQNRSTLVHTHHRYIFFKAVHHLHQTGILGIGDIGEEISRVLTLGFNAKVIGFCNSPEKRPNSTATKLVSGEDGLLEMLSAVDYLINVLPHTPETIGLLNCWYPQTSECYENVNAFRLKFLILI